jgi:RES domain-containing protein
VVHSSVHDPRILDALSAIEPVSFEATVYRAVFQGRDPTVGSLAGGRWSPPQTFEALYTSLDAECAIAEVRYHLERQPTFPSRPVELHALNVVTERTIDISTEEACRALGLDEAALGSLDYTACQEVGHAAEFLGFDSFKVRSARCDSDNMVIIVCHLTNAIEPASWEVVDWSKYR